MLQARLDKPSIIQTYTGTAKVYDLWAALTETKARKIAVDFANPSGSDQLLEVAVGTGLTFEALVERNQRGKNIGLDLTPAMLAKADRRMSKTGFKSYEIFEGDAENLAFEDNSFDVLVNNYMFDLLPEDKFLSVLAEFKRVLKPTGRLVLTNMAQGRKASHRFFEKVYQFNPKWMGGCRGVKLEDYLLKAGFEIENYQYLAQMGFPSEVFKVIPKG